MTDRRPINPNVNVPKPGGGEQPRSRNKDGQIRDKRSDAENPAENKPRWPSSAPVHCWLPRVKAYELKTGLGIAPICSGDDTEP